MRDSACSVIKSPLLLGVSLVERGGIDIVEVDGHCHHLRSLRFKFHLSSPFSDLSRLSYTDICFKRKCLHAWQSVPIPLVEPYA